MAEEAETIPALPDEIRDLALAMRPKVGATAEEIDQAARDLADATLHLLNERGHYLPGCPPAAQIMDDAKQFAGQLSLAMLTVRLLRIAQSPIKTPESKGMETWLNDYIDGKNHGPIGKPMFWPGGLPGLAQQLRQWGFQPTPTKPQYVARIPGSEQQPEGQGALN